MRLASRNIADEVVARILVAAKAVRNNAPAELIAPPTPRVINGALPPGFTRVDLASMGQQSMAPPPEALPPLDSTGVDTAKVAQGQPMAGALLEAQNTSA